MYLVLVKRASGLLMLAIIRKAATNWQFDLITIEVIIPSMGRQIKSDRLCPHLQSSSETVTRSIQMTYRQGPAARELSALFFDAGH